MSLRYARWTRDPHVLKGGSWDRPSRPREDRAPTGRKVRWSQDLQPPEPVRAVAREERQGSLCTELVDATLRGGRAR